MALKMSSSEDAYFAREEAEKLHRMHQERRKKLTEQEREEMKKLHHGHCPKCGDYLETIMWRTVEVEKCFNCEAIVLDKGELERLAGEEEEGTYLRSFLDIFSFKKDT